MLEERQNYEELYERWRSAHWRRKSRATAINHIVERYNAYLIPLNAIEGGNFLNDSELRHYLVSDALTITAPRTLFSLIEDTFGSYEHFFGHIEECDERLSYTWMFDDPDSTVSDFVIHEHAYGHRVTILLEVCDDVVVGFKGIGILSDLVSDYLNGYLGLSQAFPEDGSDIPSMVEGDLSDPGFQLHLAAAARWNLI